MYNLYRDETFKEYNIARNYFIENPTQLIAIENFITKLINEIIQDNYTEFCNDYNEASYLYPFWANYPPDNRGRAPVGDQIPWIEVGEHAVGHKLSRLIANYYKISEIGLPSGADNRFSIATTEISNLCNGFTDQAFIFLDIKSVGPRDNFNHIVISPYQVSGDGIWNNKEENMINSSMVARGAYASHLFHPAIAPIYILSDLSIAPTIHIFVKPIYEMLHRKGKGEVGQPLESIKTICVPNGLLLTENPSYLTENPGLFFPGKDDKHKPLMKVRCRVSFEILSSIADWRVQEIKKFIE